MDSRSAWLFKGNSNSNYLDQLPLLNQPEFWPRTSVLSPDVATLPYACHHVESRTTCAPTPTIPRASASPILHLIPVIPGPMSISTGPRNIVHVVSSPLPFDGWTQWRQRVAPFTILDCLNYQCPPTNLQGKMFSVMIEPGYTGGDDWAGLYWSISTFKLFNADMSPASSKTSCD